MVFISLIIIIGFITLLPQQLADSLISQYISISTPELEYTIIIAYIGILIGFIFAYLKKLRFLGTNASQALGKEIKLYSQGVGYFRFLIRFLIFSIITLLIGDIIYINVIPNYHYELILGITLFYMGIRYSKISSKYVANEKTAENITPKMANILIVPTLFFSSLGLNPAFIIFNTLIKRGYKIYDSLFFALHSIIPLLFIAIFKNASVELLFFILSPVGFGVLLASIIISNITINIFNKIRSDEALHRWSWFLILCGLYVIFFIV